MNPQRFRNFFTNHSLIFTIFLCLVSGLFTEFSAALGASDSTENLEVQTNALNENPYKTREKIITHTLNHQKGINSWPSDLSKMIVLFTLPTSDEFKKLLRDAWDIQDFDQIAALFSYRNHKSDQKVLNFYKNSLQPVWREELRLKNLLKPGPTYSADFFTGLATLGVIINTWGNLGWIGASREYSKVPDCELASDHPYTQLCKSLDGPDEDGYNCAVEFETNMNNTIAFYCINADDRKIWDHSASEDARIDTAILVNTCVQLSGVACWTIGLTGHLIRNKIKSWRRARHITAKNQLETLIGQFQKEYVDEEQEPESTDGTLSRPAPGQPLLLTINPDPMSPEGKMFVEKILEIHSR